MASLIRGEEVQINGEWVMTNQYLPDPTYYEEVLCTIEDNYHWYKHGIRHDAKAYHTEYLRYDGDCWIGDKYIVTDKIVAWLPPVAPFMPEV